MQIQLDRIRDEPFQWQESLEIDPSSLDHGDLKGLSPVRWDGEIMFTDPGYYLRGRLEYTQNLECDRCLEPVAAEVSEKVERLILSHQSQPAEELELQEQDMNVIHLDGEEFDSEPILLEQLQLNIPMKPLCRPDCSGLCPECGANRNQGSCQCSTVTVDPRWAALAALKDRSQPDGQGED